MRANPKLSGTKHNVFGIQTGVAISFLVKRRKGEGLRDPLCTPAGGRDGGGQAGVCLVEAAVEGCVSTGGAGQETQIG